MSRKKLIKKKFICFCNGIDQSTIEGAIKDGCTTLDEVFDRTTAGVGACGGSCRPYIRQMLEQYLETKTFPRIERKSKK